jgi:hypothetical protein
MMAFAARAFRAVFAVPHCALQQRTAQQLARDRQFADQLVTRTEAFQAFQMLMLTPRAKKP